MRHPLALGALLILGIILAGPSAAPLAAQNLEVVSISPTSNHLTAPVTSAITITFDRPIASATVDANSFWAFGRWSGTASGNYSFSPGGESVTLTPSQPFSAGEQVMVLLSVDIEGTDGVTLRPGGYSFLFWTVASPGNLTFTEIDSFSTRTSPQVSTRSYGGAGSDLDNDGHLDLAVINEDTADVRVYLNAANGSGLLGPMVQPPSAINLQGSPNEPGDFDRDGNTDLVVGNGAADSISVLLGNGDGTFQPQQEIFVGNNPRGVAVLDVEGDGDLDIVNTNSSSGNLSLMLNNGSGVFGAPSFFDGNGSGERSLATADMNEDGFMDLVVGAINGGTINVLLSNGNGTFSFFDSSGNATGTWMLALGDLNGDGHVDVTSCNSSQNNGTVYFGDGNGSLGTANTYSTDPFALATDVGDLDGDGDLDWVISSFSGDWFLFLNDGAGNFSFAQEFLAPVAASCATLMDLDTDGVLDLVLIDEIADVVILERQGSNPVITALVRGDANGDGAVDLGDAVAMLDALFAGASGDACQDVRDVNDDGTLDISDPIYALAYLFSGGANPPAPFPLCGDDPTGDPLDCVVSQGCL